MPKERELMDPALAPLVVRGLPPRSRGWAPKEATSGQQSFGHGIEGKVYGDGSAIQAGDPEGGVATWCITRQCYDPVAQDAANIGANSGVVPGWFPTAPRSEIWAYIEALRCMCLSFEYVGDCQHVLDIARQGIPPVFTSSACFNADLWRQARRLLHDHGLNAVTHTKTKAHRSRTAAVTNVNGDDDSVEHWLGNRAADAAAKRLAKSTFDGVAFDERSRTRGRYSLLLNRVAYAVSTLLQHAPLADGRI